jgi:hypothetical protein
MNESLLLASLRQKVSGEIDIEAEGLHRYIVYTPFMFDDGDHYVIILRNENGQWILSDEGHTLMHLTYSGVDLSAPTRAKIIEEALSAHGVESVGGELKLAVPHEDFGNALFSFMQAIAQTSTVSQMTKERVASSFYEDLRELIFDVVPEARIEANWHDPEIDPAQKYTIDYKINSLATPWFVFGVHSTDKCRAATIACLTYEIKNARFYSLVVFQDQTGINRNALAQLSDVAGKQFSSLGERNRIANFFREEILSGANP